MIDFLNKKWKIWIPSNYSSDVSEECYSFFDDNGCGALQISDYISEIDMSEYKLEYFSAAELNDVKKVKCGDFVGYEFQGVDNENIFWRKLLLQNNQLVLLITFNAEHYDKNDSLLINKILSSLQAI